VRLKYPSSIRFRTRSSCGKNFLSAAPADTPTESGLPGNWAARFYDGTFRLFRVEPPVPFHLGTFTDRPDYGKIIEST
ncbi:hypothetical protein, partial [Rikenella microfusus]|uniref:hypothetical protein n=1 Tax=Rikenella microfusus TaxID=28139 RepID=UPI003AB11D81